jgi:hypothetical protein
VRTFITIWESLTKCWKLGQHLHYK